MTKEQALWAQRNRAYVKVRPEDGHSTWHCGRIVEVEGGAVAIRVGKGGLRNFDLSKVQFDETENRREGIEVPDFGDNPNEPCVIFIHADCTGWDGDHWTEDDAKWRRYSSRHAAEVDRDRFKRNGTKGTEVLRLSTALHRYNAEMERRTLPSAGDGYDSTARVAAESLTGKGSIAPIKPLTDVLADVTRLESEKQADERDDQNDDRIIDEDRIEITRRQASIDSAMRRKDRRRERSAGRDIELAGLRAKLKAIISAF